MAADDKEAVTPSVFRRSSQSEGGSDTHHFLTGDGFRERLNPSYVSIDFA
jgi:hypothetical protein